MHAFALIAWESRGFRGGWRLKFATVFVLALVAGSLQAQTMSTHSAVGLASPFDGNLRADGILLTHAGEFQLAPSPLSLENDAAAAEKSSDHPEESLHEGVRRIRRANLTRSIFRKHRWDLSIEGGRFHNNIPFVFDFLLGDGYNMTGLDYTLAPFIVSLRWQLSGIHGHKMFRGTWEGSFSGSYTMIPRGPETRYFAYMMGIRRNFVEPNWKVIPYAEFRAGMGNINAKQPLGVYAAQGQDFAFTLFMNSGFRYLINDRYSLFVGAGYMHISNLYLSEPRYLDYGINVYGPMMGIDFRLGKHRDEIVR